MLRAFHVYFVAGLAALNIAWSTQAAAQASLVDRVFTIDATLVHLSGPADPVPNPFHLEIGVQFDSALLADTPVSAINWTYYSVPSAYYDNLSYVYRPATDFLLFGSSLSPNGSGCLFTVPTSFCIGIVGATGSSPTANGIFVTGTSGVWWATDDGRGGTLSTAYRDIPPVPEPSTWAMMLLGFGAVGFAMRRERRKNAPALNWRS